MKKEIVRSLKMLLLMTILTGIIYPLFITAIGQIFFSDKANGSLYIKDGKVRGSFLLGQNFTDSTYFHSRPSAINYNPIPSGASNLGLTSKLLHEQFNERKSNFLLTNGLDPAKEVSAEMLFASASGVDPHISKQAAYLQVFRIAKARSLNKIQTNKIYKIVDSLTEYPQFGFLGNEAVNVLKLNIKLDLLTAKKRDKK
ncbi:MAG: potassium-transporting ATPase subunit KdpC [Ignavibacteriaceae bacterium]|nr:potassium-transporting ATPase subunit KdpC [Ignavibacteriaceae bacterium]